MLRNTLEKLMEAADEGVVSDQAAGRAAEQATQGMADAFKAAGFPVPHSPLTNAWGQSSVIIVMHGLRIPAEAAVQNLPTGMTLSLEFQSPITKRGSEDYDRWEALGPVLARHMEAGANAHLKGFGRMRASTKGREQWPYVWIDVDPEKVAVAIEQFPERVGLIAQGLARKLKADGLLEAAEDRPKKAARELVRALAKYKAKCAAWWEGEDEPDDQDFADMVRNYAWAGERWTDAEIAADPRQAVEYVRDVMRERARYAEENESRAVGEAVEKDPWMEAAELILTSQSLVSYLEDELAKVRDAVDRAQREQMGLKRAGAGVTEAVRILDRVLLPPLRRLRKGLDDMLDDAERVARAKGRA